MPDLEIAKEIADRAAEISADDNIDLEREAERLKAEHPDANATVEEIGEALGEEVLRDEPDIADAGPTDEKVRDEALRLASKPTSAGPTEDAIANATDAEKRSE